jgi:hypothetical protein
MITMPVLTAPRWNRRATVPTVLAGWWCKSIRWVGARPARGMANGAADPDGMRSEARAKPKLFDREFAV